MLLGEDAVPQQLEHLLRGLKEQPPQDAAADKEMRPAVTHASRAPAFLREALRRDRDALSPALRRRLTWQQALCLAPLVDLPRLKQ